MTGLADRARAIRLLVLDVDGVLTDGRLRYTGEGEETKVFHVRDGVGIKALRSAGLELAVISGRASDAVTLRMAELGIARVSQGDSDKLPLFRRLLEETGLMARQAAFMGDDLPDLPVLNEVGLAACPADAHPDIQSACHWTGTLPGGRGAVREFCDFLLSVRAEAGDGD